MHGLERKPLKKKQEKKQERKKDSNLTSAWEVLRFISKIQHYAHCHIPAQTLKSSDAR